MTLIGTTVGNIRILEELAEGGMGSVYVGFDEKLRRRVAVKAIRRERRLDARSRERFLAEARVLSRGARGAVGRKLGEGYWPPIWPAGGPELFIRP